MNRRATAAFALLATMLTFAVGAAENNEELMAAQRRAMAQFAHFDGIWRGPTESVAPSGEVRKGRHLHRVGPFLGGGIKLMEGRGYGAKGELVFNGMMVLSYDPIEKAYYVNAFARAQATRLKLMMIDDGYYFDVDEGGGTYRRVQITVKDGVWSELVMRVAPSGTRSKVFSMSLQRVGDSDWPASYVSPDP